MWPSARRPLTALESSVIEENAVALGSTLDSLMENAGRAVAEEVARRLPAPPARVAVVAGAGNNGGDGFAAAFYLGQWGYTPEIFLARPATEIRSRPARRCFERIERRSPTHVGIPDPSQLAPCPVVLDALLGTGQSGALRAPYLDAVRAIQASGAPVLSVDMPTGLGNPEALVPRWTVALTALKEGMTPATCGELIVRDIGIPAEAWLRTGPGEFAFYRPVTAHRGRGRSGRVVVIGGGPYAGAPALAGLAALRTGAERATIVAPGGAAELIQGFSPNLVVRGIGRGRFQPSDVPAICSFVEGSRPKALIVGMGAGRDPETTQAFRTLLAALPPAIPVVVDADALDALPSRLEAPRAVIATPNAGEYARVFHGDPSVPLSEQIEAARQSASTRGISLVIKGEPDLISDGEVAFQNFHHHVAQTVSGVGDILAGTIGSLLAQGLAPVHAARLASYWVGDAGIRAAGRRGQGLVATDVIEELPNALVSGLDRIARVG